MCYKNIDIKFSAQFKVLGAIKPKCLNWIETLFTNHYLYGIFIDIHVQSLPITTNVVSCYSAQARCTRYNSMWLSLSVICGRSVVFSGYSGSFTNKTDCHNIAEILMKVVLSTITIIPCNLGNSLAWFYFLYRWKASED